MNDLEWMAEAVGLARRAAELGEVPVGALVVSGTGEVVGRAHNTKETNGDPLGHAEILALRQASQRVGGWRLSDCTLYVTLEPCAMCAGALVHSRVRRLVFATEDPKAGFCGSLGNLVQDARLNHRLEVEGGYMEERSRQMLQDFFRQLRQREPKERWQSG